MPQQTGAYTNTCLKCEQDFEGSKHERVCQNCVDIVHAEKVLSPQSGCSYMQKCDAIMGMVYRDLEDHNNY